MQKNIPNPSATVLVLLAICIAGYWAWLAFKPTPSTGTQLLATPAGTLHAPDKTASLPGWKWIDTKDGFGFAAPRGTRLNHLQGKDSAVGEIIAAGFYLRYDFGFFSNSLEGAMSENDYSEERTTVDGHVAVVRRAIFRSDIRVADYATATDKSQRYFIGVYLPHVEYRPTYGVEGTWKSLSVDGAAATPGDRATVERLFKSIAFTQPPARHTLKRPGTEKER
jgi:hypothetical protein